MLHAHLENALRVLLYLGIDFSADLHYRSVISFLWYSKHNEDGQVIYMEITSGKM